MSEMSRSGSGRDQTIISNLAFHKRIIDRLLRKFPECRDNFSIFEQLIKVSPLSAVDKATLKNFIFGFDITQPLPAETLASIANLTSQLQPETKAQPISIDNEFHHDATVNVTAATVSEKASIPEKLSITDRFKAKILGLRSCVKDLFAKTPEPLIRSADPMQSARERSVKAVQERVGTFKHSLQDAVTNPWIPRICVIGLTLIAGFQIGKGVPSFVEQVYGDAPASEQPPSTPISTGQHKPAELRLVRQLLDNARSVTSATEGEGFDGSIIRSSDAEFISLNESDQNLLLELGKYLNWSEESLSQIESNQIKYTSGLARKLSVEGIIDYGTCTFGYSAVNRILNNSSYLAQAVAKNAPTI